MAINLGNDTNAAVSNLTGVLLDLIGITDRTENIQRGAELETAIKRLVVTICPSALAQGEAGSTQPHGNPQ